MSDLKRAEVKEDFYEQSLSKWDHSAAAKEARNYRRMTSTKRPVSNSGSKTEEVWLESVRFDWTTETEERMMFHSASPKGFACFLSLKAKYESMLLFLALIRKHE